LILLESPFGNNKAFLSKSGKSFTPFRVLQSDLFLPSLCQVIRETSVKKCVIRPAKIGIINDVLLWIFPMFSITDLMRIHLKPDVVIQRRRWRIPSSI